MTPLAEFANRMKVADSLTEAARIFRRMGEKGNEIAMLNLVVEQRDCLNRIKGDAVSESQTVDAVRKEEFITILKRFESREKIRKLNLKKVDPLPAK